MSDFRVIQTIGLEMRRILFEGLSGSEEVTDSFTSINNISLASPAAIADNSAPGSQDALLSLFLYQVAPDGHLNNRPLVRTGPGEQHYPPLSVDLFFLLTPVTNSPEDNLVILGRAMQVLAAHPILRANFLDSTLRSDRPEARIMINPVSLEELTRIWNALNQPYRLSVCYQVQAIAIDSARAPETAEPVQERMVDIHQIVGEGASE